MCSCAKQNHTGQCACGASSGPVGAFVEGFGKRIAFTLQDFQSVVAVVELLATLTHIKWIKMVMTVGIAVAVVAVADSSSIRRGGRCSSRRSRSSIWVVDSISGSMCLRNHIGLAGCHFASAIQ